MESDYDIIEFKDSRSFRNWLDSNHQKTKGIWLRIYKKASNITSITYAEALDEALCYGWIDGKKKSYDELSFIQKFTPRRPRSMWSKRNVEHVSRLTEQGRMTPAGLHEVTKAQADGRWAAAYDTPSEMVVPDYFLRRLQLHPKASENFTRLNKTNKYAIAWKLQTVKTEAGRMRRMDKIIVKLEADEKLF